MSRNVRNSNEKAQRNRDIFDEYQEGSMVIELAERYSLSPPRIHRIVKQEKIKFLEEENAKLRVELNNCRRRTK